MPASSVVKNANDGTLTILASGGSPSLELLVDAGDFQLSDVKKKLQDTVVYQSRGAVNSVRHTTRNFPTVQFTGQHTTFSGNEAGGTSNPWEAVLGYGATWGSAGSTLGANADVYTVDLQLDIAGTSLGDSGDHQITMHDVELTISYAEGDPTAWTCSGIVYGEIDGDIETLVPT